MSTRDLDDRTEKLLKEMNRSEDDLDRKTLMQVTQGSVVMQVHGGAMEICREFLSLAPSKDDGAGDGDDDEGDRIRLRYALLRFVHACERAVALCRALLEAELAEGERKEAEERRRKQEEGYGLTFKSKTDAEAEERRKQRTELVRQQQDELERCLGLMSEGIRKHL